MATYSFAWQASLTDGAEIVETGGSLDAVKLTNFTYGTAIHRRMTIQKYETSANVYKLWDYTNGDWQAMIIQVLDQSGYVLVAGQADQFASGVPTGSAARVQQWDVSCYQPLVIGPNAVRCHATLTPDATGVNGSGIPNILISTTSVSGKYANIWIRNASTTTATEVDVWFLG